MRVARPAPVCGSSWRSPLAAVLAVGLVGFRPRARRRRVKLTMFIWAGANQASSPARWSRVTSRRTRTSRSTFRESTNAATSTRRMLAAKQADPNAPLVNFGYFNVDLANRGRCRRHVGPDGPGPHPGAG